MAISLSRVNSVSVLNLGDDENRWSPEWIADVTSALDEVENGEPTALVTVASGKFFTNGLDLDWLSAHPNAWEEYVTTVHGLLARALTLGVPTVAAINGHAFGAGAMLAMAHDFRIMRDDRGFLCFPEVDIRIPFTPGMAALIQAKVAPPTAIAAMTTGQRYGGSDALRVGLVDAVATESELLGCATAMLEPLVGKDVGTLRTIKETMFATAATLLRNA